jgi:hypothetical protein
MEVERMTTRSPFVGEYAEYYSRSSVKTALRSDSPATYLARENEQLRQEIKEIKEELAFYKNQIEVLKSHAPRKSPLRELLERLGFFR